MIEFIIKLVISAAFMVLIKIGVAAFHHSISWLIAAFISLIIVFGGWLLIDGDWIE